MALSRIRCRARLAVVVAAVLGLAATALVPTMAGADPAPPGQTVESVTAELSTLARQNESLTEQYNQAQIEITKTQAAVDTARKAAVQAAADLQKARAELDRTLAAQYEGGSFSATGALLTSDNGQSYLDALNSLNLLSQHRASVVAQVQQAKARAQQADRTATTLLDQATRDRNAISAQRDKIIADTATYKSLLATLTAAQQAAYRNRNVVANTPAQAQVVEQAIQATTPVHAGSAAAQKAVNFALAQVGKAYVFAASGPNAYDCSGLTAAAWAQAGISLPHFAAAQYNYGTHVTVDQLQPGDLIFLYQPITHVEIYIGNGQAVSAADESLGVIIVNISHDMADWAGATRLT